MRHENISFWWNWSNLISTLRLSFEGHLCRGLKDYLMVYESTQLSTFNPNDVGSCCKEYYAQKRTDSKQALYKCASFKNLSLFLIVRITIKAQVWIPKYHKPYSNNSNVPMLIYKTNA